MSRNATGTSVKDGVAFVTHVLRLTTIEACSVGRLWTWHGWGNRRESA